MGKKLLSLIMALTMVLSLLPVTAVAAWAESTPTSLLGGVAQFFAEAASDTDTEEEEPTEEPVEEPLLLRGLRFLGNALTTLLGDSTATVGGYTVLLPDGVTLPDGADGATVTPVTASDTNWGTTETTTWYVATGDITIDHTVTVLGDVHLILCDGAKLTVTETGDNPAIWINATDTNLTIYAQSTGTNMGCLTASNTNFGEIAIGEEGDDSPHGDITINGGKISANANK